MRSVSKIATMLPLLFGLAFGLVACSAPANDDSEVAVESSPSPEPTVETVEVESAAPEAVEMLPFDEDGPVISHYEPEDSSYRGAEFSDIPKGWPDEIPLPASGEPLSIERVEGEQEFYHLYYRGTSQADFDALLEQLRDAGFEDVTTDEMYQMYTFESDDFFIDVNAGTAAGEADSEVTFRYWLYWEWDGLGTR